MLIVGGHFNGGILSDGSMLYPFSSFTFTSNIVGPTGPTLGNLYSLYSTVGNSWVSSTSYLTVIPSWQGYQIWTVPSTGLYQITVAGSRSGVITAFTGNTTYGNAHGRGAIVQGTFALTQGQQLTIVSGQPSANTTQPSTYSSPGGGGGSFVMKGNIATGFANVTPLIIAGGGGAPGAWSSNTSILAGGYGVTTKRGGNSAGYITATGISSRTGAPGGIDGYGGNTHVSVNGTVSPNGFDSGGGGGFFGNGISRSTTGWTSNVYLVNSTNGGGGNSIQFGANGGIYSPSYIPPSTSHGGFGCGGGAGPITGGGGGGYSGGGGAFGGSATTIDSGGGGGSFIDGNAISVATSDGLYDISSTFNGASITNLGNYNNAAGYINIVKV